MNELVEIRRFLKEHSNESAKVSWRRFVPSSEKVHGVYLSEVNSLVSKYKSGGFKLVEELWSGGFLEERLLAAKILGRVGGKDPGLTLRLIRRFVNDVVDWAVCDTLATQGVRSIIKKKQKELLELSRELVVSENLWKRRFGVVLLINFKKDNSLRSSVEDVLSLVEDDSEYYVKKAVDWVKRSLK